MTKNKSLLRIVLAVSVLFVASLLGLLMMVWMPLHSYSGTLSPLDNDQQEIRDALRSHVRNLTTHSMERNASSDEMALETASDYIVQRLKGYGYEAQSQSYSVNHIAVRNLIAEKPGSKRPDEVLVVGAHYDSAVGTTGADDNASGVAALIELAYVLRNTNLGRTVRFVFFTNEEPPFFQTSSMGSMVYANWLHRKGTRVVGMISIDSIGSYSDTPNSQHYPPMLSTLYGSRANFVAFVGNFSSSGLVRRMVKTFRQSTRFPSEGIAAPSGMEGIGWSDHWSFWQEGYPAVLVTDTALFRYEHYHKSTDTVDKLDFDRMARVVSGLQMVIADLVTIGR